MVVLMKVENTHDLDVEQGDVDIAQDCALPSIDPSLGELVQLSNNPSNQRGISSTVSTLTFTSGRRPSTSR